MRYGILAVVLLGLSAMVGCSSAEQKPALDPADDPAYLPPGQGDLAIGADPEVKEKKAPRARKLLQPNRGVTSDAKLQARAGN